MAIFNIFRSIKKGKSEDNSSQRPNARAQNILDSIKQSICLKDYAKSEGYRSAGAAETGFHDGLTQRIAAHHAKIHTPCSSMTLEDLAGDYQIAITERSIDNPFVVDKKIIRDMKRCSDRFDDEYGKAKAIFDWIEDNVTYGKKKRGVCGYRNSGEVIRAGEGVCGEMAYLYVTAARCIGLKSNFVDVERDFRNEKVRHACASVHLKDGRIILADNAYYTFDIKHKKFRILNDHEAIVLFKEMRY